MTGIFSLGWHFFTVAFGWFLFVGVGGVYALAGFLNARLVARIGIHNMMRFGFFIMLLSAALLIIGYFLWGISIWSIAPMMILFYFGAMFIFPNSNAIALTPFSTIAGYAAALYGTLQIGCSAETGERIDQLKANIVLSIMRFRVPQLLAWEVSVIIKELREQPLRSFGVDFSEKANRLENTLNAVLSCHDGIHINFNHPAQVCHALLEHQPSDEQGNTMPSLRQLLTIPCTTLQRPLPYLDRLYQFIAELSDTLGIRLDVENSEPIEINAICAN